jgi:uncharacterized protein (DUF1697 family)
MNRYISLLRGINVSGQKKIKMADLKELYTSLGYRNVVTYIQSGNVIFDADSLDRTKIRDELESTVETHYGFQVPVEIRTGDELEGIIRNCPFGYVDLKEDGTKVMVTFLSEEPTAEKVSELQKYVKNPEIIVVSGREVYLNCPDGYGKTKLSNVFIERILGVKATTRNWKSIHKLYELSVESV